MPGSSYSAPEDSPLDASLPNLRAATPQLDDVIRFAIKQAALGLRVAAPASVIAVTDTQQVDVQLTLRARYAVDQQTRDIKPIVNVPVVMPVGQDYRIKLPVKEGDLGLVIFSDRSLDAWKAAASTPQTLDPADVRAHHLTDAVFVPGLVPFKGQTKDETTDLVVTAGKAEARWQQDGKFVMASTAPAGQEFLDLMNQTVDALGALIDLLGSPQTMTLTFIGPQPFLASTVALLKQQRAVVDKLKKNLESITGKMP